LLDFHRLGGQQVAEFESEIRDLEARWNDWVQRFALIGKSRSDELTIGIYGEDPSGVRWIARSYAEAVRWDLSLTSVGVERTRDGQRVISTDGREFLIDPAAFKKVRRSMKGGASAQVIAELRRIGLPLTAGKELASGRSLLAPDGLEYSLQPNAREFLDRSSDDVLIGVILCVKTPQAPLRFGEDTGVHVIQQAGRDQRCYVHCSEDKIEDYDPPQGVSRRGTFRSVKRRRIYALDSRRAEDFEIERVVTWGGSDGENAVAQLGECHLMKKAFANVGLER
ncbi:MAG: hypothetical protein AAF517_21070, partial [Planctomycetota bacterium]